MRHVDDDAGIQWVVYAVSPDELSAGRRDLLPSTFRDGWLVFDSAHERRRLAPVPEQWMTIPDEALLGMLGRAERVTLARPR
jgi:hypothetical protein